MSDEVETDLVAAIAADPDAIAPRLVYGDYLEAKADPRGELIAVQVALLAKPDDLPLHAREKELASALTARLLEGTPLDASLIVRWHLGFVDALALDVRTIRTLRTTHRAWFAQPAFACVRDIAIESKYARNLRFIRHLGLAPTLRRLRFGDVREPMPEPTLVALASRLPQVTALHLRCATVPDLAPLRPLALRELHLQVETLDDAAIARIAAEPRPLDTFGLEARTLQPDVHGVLSTLYNGAHLPSVKHFLVGGAIPVTLVIEALAAHGRAATVTSVTGNFYRATHDALVAVERHRALLAHIRFEPALGESDYYDVEGLTAVGTFLNYRLERPAEAIAYYERALQRKPEHTVARQQLATALRKVRRLDESLVAYDVLIAQTKKPTAMMFNGRHYTLCELGRRADAIADLERAVALEPSYADAWNNLGVELQYTGHVDRAFAAFRRCLELSPQHNFALRNEGDLLLELGRADEALRVYERLRAEKGDSPALAAVIAHARLETGDAAGARTILDARLADPAQARDPRLYVMRALALRALGDRAAARADLDALAHTTDNAAWYAVTLFVRALDDRALWRQAVPDDARVPRAIADAVLAHAPRERPAHAKALGDPTVDDQIDCAELALMSALLAGDRGLAVLRAQAAATLYAEQGPHYARKWWPTLATVAAFARRELDDEARALLQIVMRALRGRHRLADVIGLASSR